jgi:hypothetical protein
MRFAVATLHAIAAAVFSAVVFGFAAGRLNPVVAAASLVLGAAIGLLSLWSSPKSSEPEPWRIEAWGGAALVVFALFAARSFLWLVFRAHDDLWVLSPNNLGDLSLHLTYVRYLANGAPFWPENPIFAGEPLTYPVGIDLFNSLLDFLGVDVLSGFIWVGLIASACTAAMLWRWGRGFAVAGFLFAGGLLGFKIFTTGKLVDFQAEAAWKSLPLALFVTQRGLLYALPAGLALLASWRSRFLEPERATQRLPLWSEWLLYATMPVFHLHTFLFLSFLAAWWFCFVRGAQKHLALVVGLAVGPATFLVWCVTGGFHGASMVSLHPGWMQGDENFFRFWLTNFGLFLPLAIWLVVELFLRRSADTAVACVAPAAIVFLACCIWKFAPWEWDNTKLMLWAYVVVLPSMWQLLFARWPEWLRIVVGVPLFFSGALSLLGGLTGDLVTGEDRSNTTQPRLGYSLQTKRSEIDGAFWAASDIPITDRFIANPNYNHPLLLAGRLVVMGYEGHIWSHGLDPSERKQTVARILNGSPTWREDARRLGARWLFWGDQESEACPDSTRPWEKECPVHATGSWGTIYDLRPGK